MPSAYLSSEHLFKARRLNQFRTIFQRVFKSGDHALIRNVMLNSGGDNLLVTHLRNCHIDIVTEILEQTGDMLVNLPDLNGDTPLHMACKIDDDNADRIAHLLIKHKANINARNHHDRSPLHEAAGNGHLELVQQLLDLKAEILCYDDENMTPIDIAAKNNYPQIAGLMVNALGMPEKQNSDTLLYALRKGKIEDVREALEHLVGRGRWDSHEIWQTADSIVPHNADGDKIISLLASAENFYDDIHHARDRWISAFSEPAVHGMREDEHFQTLVSRMDLPQIDLFVFDEKGMTFLQEAVSLLDNTYHVEGMVDTNASEKSKNGRSTMMALIKALFLMDANPVVYDIDGNTPLHLLVQRNAPDDVIYLALEQGANPFSVNATGETPVSILAKLEARKLRESQKTGTDSPPLSDIIKVYKLRNRGAHPALPPFWTCEE